MVPIFLVVAIIGCCVGIFFTRKKRRSPAHSNQRPQSFPPDSSHMSALTEEPKPLRIGTFNTEETGAKRDQLEQINKFTTVT
jgi:hypothetical protein